MSCKFSIVIPVYNRPISIIKTLESIKYQKTNFEFEILIVDDSVDETSNIIKNFSLNNKDLTIIHIVPKYKSGVSNARNLGIKKAQGEILVFLDSDDILLEGGLNQIGNAFDKNKNLSLYFGSCIYKSGKKIKFTDKNLLPYGSYLDYVKTIKQPEMLPAFKIEKSKLNFYQFDYRVSGFEHLLYLKILRNGGMFFRDSKEIRLYDDIGEDRLCITNPKNYINMRNGYVIHLKSYWKEFLINNPKELVVIFLKIIIYNRLIKRQKYFKISNIVSFLFLPIPQVLIEKLILVFKSY